MSRPPGQRRGPGDESEPLETPFADTAILDPDRDIVRLRHGLQAVYFRDTDTQSIARRRLTRGRKLNAQQREAYEAWLAEQRQDAAS